MALSKTGLSDLIYDNVSEAFKPRKKGRPSLRKLADALADAVVTHIQDNAVVTVNVDVNTTTTVAVTDAGLQRDSVTPFDPTLGPSTEKTLDGIGTGNGTGTIT